MNSWDHVWFISRYLHTDPTPPTKLFMQGESETPPRPLSVPPVSRARFGTNLIRHAVCELRFPTLFEIDGQRPPPKFAAVLRKEYPNYEQLVQALIGEANALPVRAHAFRSKKNRWTATLRPAAVTLETNEYDSFPDFKKRLELVIRAASEVIDSEIFTRVGLRYINAVPYERQTIAEWVRQELVAPLADGVFGDVDEHNQTIRGSTDAGGYRFAHGVRVRGPGQKPEYMLDFDFFQEDVLVQDALAVAQQLHDREFNLFMWAMGPRALAHMGPSKLK
jgi:uncharacterized protein (TIGR04255 family)